MSDPTTDPYTPQPVPNTGNPELERFLAEELDRISAILNDLGSTPPG